MCYDSGVFVLICTSNTGTVSWSVVCCVSGVFVLICILAVVGEEILGHAVSQFGGVLTVLK